MRCFDVHVFYLYRLLRKGIDAADARGAIDRARSAINPYSIVRGAGAEQAHVAHADQFEYAEEISHYLVDQLASKGVNHRVGSDWYIEGPDYPIKVEDGRHEAYVTVEIKDGQAMVYANRPDVHVIVLNHDSMSHTAVGLGCKPPIALEPGLSRARAFIDKYGGASALPV
jgi:hypothetical protein